MTTHIYAAGSSRDGPIKIGISAEPARRLGELQTASPVRLHIYWLRAIRAEEARDVEYRIHYRLKEHRLAGEWFAIPIEVAVETILLLTAPNYSEHDGCGDKFKNEDRFPHDDDGVYDPPREAPAFGFRQTIFWKDRWS